MLEHVGCNGQMMDRAMAWIREFQDEEFIETGLAQVVNSTTFGTIHISSVRPSLRFQHESRFYSLPAID